MRLGHFDSLFDGIVPSLARILTKQHGIRGGGEYLLKTPENAISETLNFKMSLSATALKNLCLGASSKAACYLKRFDSPAVRYMLVLDVCTTAF